MATRSGRPFRPQQQTSKWCIEYEIVSEVLFPYLNLDGMLKARRVCQAWRSSWGKLVPGLMLDQPKSVTAARELGRKAAAAFPDVSKARIRLYSNVTGFLFRSGASEHLQEATDDTERPEAAVALLRQLQGLDKLQRLHFASRYCDYHVSLPVLVPHLSAQHLRVLNLTEVSHSSSVLPVIAAHLTRLQELVLRKMRPCSHADFAALAAVPTLRNLSCQLELTPVEGQGLGALKQVSSLTVRIDGQRPKPLALNNPAIAPEASASGGSAGFDVSAITQLSGMTGLKSLDITCWWAGEADAAIRSAWGPTLCGLQGLERLIVPTRSAPDGLLIAAGRLPKLAFLRLYFGYGYGDMRYITARGAQAVAHVEHIELWYCKGLEKCCRELTSLPNIRRFHTTHSEDVCWCEATVCTCCTCLPFKTHCRVVSGGYYRCCGWCKGQPCACKPARI